MNRAWLPYWLFGDLLASGPLGACYSASARAPEQQTAASQPPTARRVKGAPDDCAPEPGKPPPQPTRIQYTGVARAARCDREVYTIMGGVTHFLGVECRHCHLEPDYTADTHNKQIANWMARELIPRLERRDAAAQDNGVWCKDCHNGKAKFLGNPRQRSFAIDWMTTHLVEDFQTTDHKPPRCKACHGADLGSPDFRPKVILGDISPLGPVPAPAAAPAPESAPAPSSAPAPESPPAPAPAPASAPVPDFGAR